MDGGPGKDGIPALTNPPIVGPDDPDAAYLLDTDRVIGLVVDGAPLAVPLNIGWWHEVVNLDGAKRLAVTHCPLTGSSLVFDREPIGGAEFGVSGLLYLNNLMMYDRRSAESLWPQMSRGARCGLATGTALPMVTSLEMTWAGWRSLHPDTRVISSNTGFQRNYRNYPYGGYDSPSNSALLFPVNIDPRRAPKERVLGLPVGERGGIAFPFFALDSLGSAGAVATTLDGDAVVVFWDRARLAAAAYLATLDGEPMTFTAADGRITDPGGSTWSVEGVATEGPLAGRRLDPVASAFVAFWFAWALFYPDTELWTREGGLT